jgi:hypothetical protein
MCRWLYTIQQGMVVAQDGATGFLVTVLVSVNVYVNVNYGHPGVRAI